MSEILEEVGINLKAGAKIKAFLKGCLGKRVALQPDSSEVMEGIVVLVCDGLAHITKLSSLSNSLTLPLGIPRQTSPRIRLYVFPYRPQDASHWSCEVSQP